MSEDSKSMDVIEINEDDFESEVLASKIPVLVEFGATWCAPCKRQLPILKELAVENPDVKFVKIDVDQNRDLANKYSIKGVPTLMLFEPHKNGFKNKSKVGLMSKNDLQKFIIVE